MADPKGRQQLYQYHRRKDEEMKRMQAEKEAVEARLAKCLQDLNKMHSHSKSQSERVKALQVNLQEKELELVTLRRDNSHVHQLVEEHQHMIAGLQTEVVALKKDKRELASDLETAKVTAAVYKEDFEKERSDRARAAGKIDSLTLTAATAADTASKLAEEQAARQGEIDHLAEELRVKTAQIKNYKKQVDSLQVELQKAQQIIASLEKQRNEMVPAKHSSPSPDSPIASNGPRGRREFLKLGFGKRSKSKDELALEREKENEKIRMKTMKRERERSMKETKEKRKAAMEEMDEKRLKKYLENEMNHLELENIRLKNQLETSEATIKSLVEKLHATEALVSKATGSSVPHSAEDKTYSPGESRGSSIFYVKHHGAPHTQGQTSPDRVYQPRRPSTEGNHRDTSSALDFRDPALEAKDRDYVNLPPASAPYPGTRAKTQSPVDVSRQKSPKPTPRSITHNVGRRERLGQEQSVSMLNTTSGEMEREKLSDISSDLEEEIRSRAWEVMKNGRDERTYTLTSIPFDPYLECLYCNLKFRYGEIQKYRKHVEECMGASAL